MKIGILGAGAYGLALAHIANNNSHEIIMWDHSEEEKKNLDKTRKSKRLPEYTIPASIQFTNNLGEAIIGMDLIIMAIPAFAFEETVKNMTSYLAKNQIVLI